MPVVISMLRGVNVGGHNKLKMDALASLYQSLDLQDARTYVQSGNVVFWTAVRNLPAVSKRIEDGIERTFGFRPTAIVRTPSDLRQVIANNPFATREHIDPSKLLVCFFATDPDRHVRDKLLSIKADPEELRMVGRELTSRMVWAGQSCHGPSLRRGLKARRPAEIGIPSVSC